MQMKDHPSNHSKEIRGGKMKKLSEGMVIGIPCSVSPGPFSGELLINFDTIDSSVSGFVKESELKEVNGQWFVRATIQDAEEDRIDVRIRGSFFTTNGLATISREMAYAA